MCIRDRDMMESVKSSTVTTLMKNNPEDLAVFTAVTLEEPLMSLNYTSGDDLITQTSFTGAALAAGESGAPAEDGFADAPPVSYTHLTLPTILRVSISVVAVS